MKLTPWFSWIFPRSLSRQLVAALLLPFALAVGATAFTLYELDLRKHDYVILNLAGQLSAISRDMVVSSERVRMALPATGGTEYLEDIREQSERYGQIVGSLERRVLEPALTGRSDPLVCSWDEYSNGQLSRTAQHWRQFHEGLMEHFAAGAGLWLPISVKIASV